MYSVSDDYLTQVHSAVNSWRLTGTIGETEITDDNVLQGSMSITNKCAESDVGLGSVCIGVLKATFLHNTGINRFQWKGKEIKLNIGLLVNGSYEDVPMQAYTVSTAKYTAAGIVVTAYDYMEKFERAFGTDNLAGSAYELLTLACDYCGVTLGMTQEEVEALPNGGETFSFTDNSDMSTYRDLISWIAVTLGGFAIINRDGELEIKTWQTEAVDTYTSDSRITGAEYDSYITSYTGIYLTHDTTAEYYGADSGSTISIGADPFIQMSDDDDRTRFAEAIIGSINNIQYMPCKFSVACGVHLDLGDVLTISGGLIDDPVKVCVMEYTYVYRNKYTIQSYGEDPTASAQSKSDKDIAGLAQSVSASAWYIKTFTNAQDITIGDGKSVRIISISAAATATTTMLFLAEILAGVTLTDGVESATMTVTYYLEGAEITTYHPKQIYTVSGDHMIHLIYHVPVVKDAIATLLVYIEADGAEFTIDAGAITASMSGSGIATEATWDGLIDAYEDYTAITIGDLFDKDSITDSVEVTYPDSNDSTASESYTAITIGDLFDRTSIEDSVSVGTVVDNYTYAVTSATVSTYTYDSDYVTTDGAFALKTSYAYSAASETIDSGVMVSVTVDKSIYASVSGIEVS